MDKPENMEKLDAVGRAAGEKLIHASHFPSVFDLH
jgi:hypothetical protein